MTDYQAVADRLVDMIGNRAECEATVGGGESALTRFANNFIHQNVGDTGHVVGLRLAVEGRVARGATNRVDDDALQSLVSQTLEVARLSPVDPEWPGPAPQAPIPESDHWDEATAAGTPKQRASLVKAFVDAGDDMLAAGYCDTEGLTTAFANSLGQRALGRATRATIDGIHRTPTSAGSAHQTSGRIGDLDGVAAGALAAERAASGAEPYDVKPGEYEVVLGPECAATIAIFLAFYGFNGKQVAENQSFVEVGAEQFDPRVSMWDDATAPDALGPLFDADGTPKRRVDLVRDGVTTSVAHDRRTAMRLGAESTGHALPGAEAWGPLPSNIVVNGGDDTVEEMIAAVDRGLYVATFNYCRILDPKTQVVTGLTRNGTFMIENGAITGAVTNLRFTQSFVEALGPGRVLGLGDDLRFADSEFGAGLVRAPSLRLAGWNFTGGAEG
jgi:predicted Zn-dependent protease